MKRCDVEPVLRPADVLFIVPPFAWHDRPALGLHLLQGVARRAGLEAQVLYANLHFAASFDEGTHATLSRTPRQLFMGERLFARAALGTPPLGRDGGAGLVEPLAALRRSFARNGLSFDADLAAFAAVEQQIAGWLESFVPAVARYRIVGCTTSFEQSCAALAILGGVKSARPAAITILGGANCEAEMAEGLHAIGPHVDHIFAGESEETFARFLARLESGQPIAERIFHGAPVTDMDALPTPDYADYYAQLRAFLPSSALHRRGLACLTYETSRGCWWGQTQHCTFCGLNGQGMASREKSAPRVLAELKTLLAAHPVADTRGLELAPAGGVLQGSRQGLTKLVTLTDNIMPQAYYKTLLPRLADELPGVTLMYELKANVTLENVRDLVRAGVTEVQPGIESLSTGLLKLMRKGASAAQNILLMRYARACGLYLYWNLLYAFPGDALDFYTETLELMPLLHHLQPPVSLFPVVFDRFSPYFDHPERYDIRELRPMPFYAEVLPEGAPIAKIAYHFDGECRSAAREHPEIVQRLGEEVARWRLRYHGREPAELRVERRGESFALVDTRGLAGLPESQRLDERQAAMALVPRRARGSDDVAAWALAHQLVVAREGRLIPLAVATPELLAELEERHRSAARELPQIA